MGFESIVSTIKTLPPLPESVIKLDKAFRMGQPDMKTIIDIIEHDPLLTASILAKVNTPVYGLKNKIVSVMQAVTLFGLSTVRAFALKTAMDQNFSIDMTVYGITNEQFSKISAMQNALMFQWFMGVDVERAKIVVPLSFLMEMGKVIIAKELAESDYVEQFGIDLKERMSISECELEYAGITSYQVSVLLFRHWNFESIFPELIEAVDSQSEMKSEEDEMIYALKAVSTAVNVKECLSDRSIEKALIFVDKMGQDSGRFTKTAIRIREKYL